MIRIGKDLPDYGDGPAWCHHGRSYATFREGEVMDKIARVGIDLAKNVMQIHAVDGADHAVVAKADYARSIR